MKAIESYLFICTISFSLSMILFIVASQALELADYILFSVSINDIHYHKNAFNLIKNASKY